MSPLLQAAKELHEYLTQRKWKYCVIGGLAAVRWGEQRVTWDVDVALLTGIGSERKFIDALLKRFEPRIPDAKKFALDNRVLLCKATNGYELDISMAGLAYEELLVSRARECRFARGCSLPTASAEDVVVLKAIAGRPIDWKDVEGIVSCHGPRLDWTYIERELRGLCELKEDSEALDRLSLIRRTDERERKA